jgi:hypothetical protein
LEEVIPWIKDQALPKLREFSLWVNQEKHWMGYNITYMAHL